jgi:metal-responsive CopG/Arc/MetJ family transcriptional regulator
LSILTHIVMPTSVHLPKPLLDAVDRKARALRISRNQLVVRALEREVREGSDWSPGFFERLAESNSELAASVDELMQAVKAARRSKAPRRL